MPYQNQDPEKGLYLPNGAVNIAAAFSIADLKTADIEKGYVNDADDPGGETKYGITKRWFPDVDIKNLTPEAARELRRIHYWEAPGIARVAAIDPSVAIRLYDLGVNCGTATAIRMLQRAVNVVCAGHVKPSRAAKWRQVVARITRGKTIKVDGIIGPVTLSVMQACPYPYAMLGALKGEAYIYYKGLDPAYVAGWLNRMEAG